MKFTRWERGDYMSQQVVTVQVIDHSDEVFQALKGQEQIALKLLSEAMANNAMLEITVMDAVDTGRLRRSIEGDDNGKDTAYVGTNVEYAPYVEYGTSRMAARPYLKNALANYVDEYKRILEGCLQNSNV